MTAVQLSRAPAWVADDDARAVVAAARRQGRARAVAVTGGLAVTTLLLVAVSASAGDFPVPLGDVLPAMTGYGDRAEVFIVQQVRLPRIVCGVLVGLAFGASGAVFQSLVSNELASPDVIGITAGASTAAVLMIVVTGTTAVSLSFGALLGGLATAAAIYLLAYRRGITGYRLILVGIGVAAGLSSLTSYLLLRAEVEEVRRASLWLTGSLNGRGWDQVQTLALAVALVLPAALLLARPLRTLQLGDDAARGVGLRVQAARGAVTLVGVGLAAFATAAAGPIAFVAFVSAPIARRMVGGGRLALLPAALFGALLTTAADLVGREGLGEVELPVGILTGILGAPYLVWLLTRTNRLGTGD